MAKGVNLLTYANRAHNTNRWHGNISVGAGRLVVEGPKTNPNVVCDATDPVCCVCACECLCECVFVCACECVYVSVHVCVCV